MIEKLKYWDRQLFLLINGYHNPFWDSVMFWMSNKWIWIPLYLIFIFLLFRYYKKEALWILLASIVLITISDQLSSHIFKPLVMRLRPCHEPSLRGLVHTVKNKCGGSFGFYSSHATNHFAIASFLFVIFKSRIKWIGFFLFPWAAVIAYSRIYLGVHYPGDVLAGTCAGLILGLGIAGLYKKIRGKQGLNQSQ